MFELEGEGEVSNDDGIKCNVTSMHQLINSPLKIINLFFLKTLELFSHSKTNNSVNHLSKIDNFLDKL